MMNRGRWTYYAVLPYFLCLGAHAQDFPLPKNPLGGQKLFVSKGCSGCHAIMGRGGKVGSDLAKKLAGFSALGIVAMMWNHASDMNWAMEATRTMPKLDEIELAGLVAYLYAISYLDEPGDSEAGKKVFERGDCAVCHRIGNAGGTAGPALDMIKQYGSPLFLAQAMWNHGILMSGKMESRGIPRPEFKGPDMANLYKYLFSKARSSNDSLRFMAPGSPRNGERLFRSKGCIKCHRIGIEGRAVGPDLTKKALRYGAATITGLMWNHAPRMWAEMKKRGIRPAKFEDNEMADVIAYLYFLGFQPKAGDRQRGKLLVESKGCTKCHAIGGRGGKSAPSLAKSQRFGSYITILSRMWNHNIEMQDRMKKYNIRYPRLTESELIDVLAYIHAQQ